MLQACHLACLRHVIVLHATDLSSCHRRIIVLHACSPASYYMLKAGHHATGVLLAIGMIHATGTSSCYIVQACHRATGVSSCYRRVIVLHAKGM